MQSSPTLGTVGHQRQRPSHEPCRGAARRDRERGLGTEAKGLLAEMRRLRRSPRQSGSQGRYAMVEALAWQRKADEARKMAGPLRRSSWWYNATKQALAAALFFDHDFAAVWAKAAVERAVIRDSLRADALFSAVGWGRSRAARDWVATRKGGQQAKLLETIAKAEQWHDLETHARQTEIFLFGARNAAVTSSDPHGWLVDPGSLPAQARCRRHATVSTTRSICSGTPCAGNTDRPGRTNRRSVIRVCPTGH